MDVARTVRSSLMAVFLLCCLPALAAPAALIDINAASAEQLSAGLPGIGAVKAAAIVDWRDANGPFTTVEDLLQVSGIGPRTLERLRPLVTVGEALAEAADARERAAVMAVQSIVERVKRSTYTGVAPP